jgi:hypothetical protein
MKCNRMSRKLLKNNFSIEYGWKHACQEVKTMDFKPEKCAHPALLGGHRVRPGKYLHLSGAKNNNNNGKKIIEKGKTRGATRGLSRRSPILILLSP